MTSSGVEGAAAANAGQGLDPEPGELPASLAQRLHEWRVAARATRAGAPAGTVEAPGLVIVGPNNAGKSTLAQRLGAAQAVPAARGGFTAEAQIFGPESACTAWPLEGTYSGAVTPDLGWLICDTPDFDGHRVEHHKIAAQALCAADLVLVVLTPLVYANASVETFLGDEVIDRRLPWWLVVRGGDPAEALRITKEMGQALGQEPDEVFAWDGVLPARAKDHLAILECLQDRIAGPNGVGRVKGASRERVLAEGARIAEAIETASSRFRTLDADAEGAIDAAARDAAGRTMPLAETVRALREVLDPRVHPVRRYLRRSTERLGSLMGGSAARAVRSEGVRAETASLDQVLPGLLSQLKRVSRELRVQDPAPGLTAALEGLLDPVASSRLVDRIRNQLPGSDADRELFREAFRGMLEEELERRGDETALQLQMDLLITAPMAVGSAVVIKTGGLGADLVVGGLGLAASAWLERLSGYLGKTVAERARSRWVDLAAARYESHLRQLWAPVSSQLDQAVASLDRSASLVRGELGR